MSETYPFRFVRRPRRARYCASKANITALMTIKAPQSGVSSLAPSKKWEQSFYNQWIGLRENLWFPVDFPLNQSIDTNVEFGSNQNPGIVNKNCARNCRID